VTHKEILKKFDVEYIAGVGYCGPDWRKAEAAASTQGPEK
jgi:hypothetical protein